MAQNVLIAGALFSNVPSISVPDQGNNWHSFVDTSDATAIASDILSGKTAYVNGEKITGTGSGGGGSSPWHKLVNAQENTISTTSGTATSAFTIGLGSSAFTKDQIIWVHIRDKSGARNGYFFGSDAFFINYNKASSSTTTFYAPAIVYIRYNNSAYAGAVGQFGVYGYSIDSSGKLVVRKRYNSTNTLTVNSTYVTNVYALDLPDNLTLFA